jgi:hypothetical protein
MTRWIPALVLVVGLGTSFSFAQYGTGDCIEQRKLAVAHVKGQVFDPHGVPVPEAVVSLWPDGRSTVQLKTDAKGFFQFKVEPGNYILKATYPGFELTTAELAVGTDILGVFHSPSLNVILALPGMNCPWVTTSNKEIKGLVRKYATQK